jgi:digeranylgeranylglycerophospholipid reductase
MIGIIGAGPVGNYVSSLLAKKNFDVTVFEEHKSVGSPVQCTGIVTSELKNVVKVEKSCIVNEVKRVKINSPNKNSIDVKLGKKNLILCREKFDKSLYQRALDQGVKFKFNSKYKSGNKRILVGKESVHVDHLVGCDGPNSSVAKENGMFGNRKFVVGSQVRAKVKCEDDLVEFWLGVGEFGWLVPEGDGTARIGVVAYKRPNAHLNTLLKGLDRKYKVLEKQGGLIPLYNPKQVLQKNNVSLVGDSATQVKATTFGGLVPGMMAAKLFVEDRKKYSENVKKELHRDLQLNLMIRKVMDKFSPKDYDELLRLFSRDKVKDVIETHDRDFPSKFLLKLLLREPRLLKFGHKLVI